MSAKLPLHGIKVLEFAGLAPGPLCGKILSDFGATVVRVDQRSSIAQYLEDHKKSISINLKIPCGLEIAKKLCIAQDVIIDTSRPGVLEKLGLGPSVIMKDNPRIIYARLTGYGQTGPKVRDVGHDINYLALSGVLSMLGRKESKPTPPINLLADFAGGGVLCTLGIVLALLERTNTGIGKIVDCSMSEGTAYVSSFLYSSKDTILWGNPRGENVLDSGAHFYDTYETKDGKYMAVGSMESKFFTELLKGLQLTENDVDHMSNYEKNKKIIADTFKQKTQQEWSKIFNGMDACVSPVLTADEAAMDPHNVYRKNFRKVRGQWEPKAAPRLLNQDGQLPTDYEVRMRDDPPCPVAGEHTLEILKELQCSQTEIDELFRSGAVFQANVKPKL